MTHARTSPKIMGICNITPDSFYQYSRYNNHSKALKAIETMVEQGADIIDIGAYSTRSGADNISVEEEYSRLETIVPAARKEFPQISLSIDTFRATIVEKLYDAIGEFIVNDISGGSLDSNLLPTVGKLNMPYICMHIRGNPQTMQTLTDYDNVVTDVYDFFIQKVNELQQHGIAHYMIDPGFGFAKTIEQNYALLANMNKLTDFSVPIVAGISRKSMIYRLLRITPDESLTATAALNMVALQQGASILRVHDVKEAVQVATLYAQLV